jgi:hypothetical protein
MERCAFPAKFDPAKSVKFFQPGSGATQSLYLWSLSYVESESRNKT